MERLAEWVWRRWKHHFQGMALSAATLTAVFLVTLPASLIMFHLLFDVPVKTLLAFNAFALVVPGLVVPVGGAIVGREFFELTRRWADGQTDVAERLFCVGLTAPRAITIPVGFVVILVHTFTTMIYGAVLLGGSWQAYVSLWCVMTLFVLAGVAIIGVGFEHLSRPILREIAPLLDGGKTGQTQSRQWGIGSRLLAMAALIACTVGIISAAATTQFATDVGKLAGGLFFSVVTSAIFTLGYFRSFGLQPVLRPIADLIAGTRRVSQGDFSGGLLVTSDDELGVLTESFNRMQSGLAERERLHAAFGSYVDPALAERLLAQGDDLFQGEEVEVTVFFADIRNFTTYAEHATASDAVARLNSLWEIIVPILRDHHGHANKFLGDGVLAVFGVPEAITDHADHALAAASAIQQRVRETFGPDLRIGIGINTGNVIAGTVGGGGKLEFTLIGDPVNVAARVEQLTKETGDAILLTQATADSLSNPPTELIERGPQVVRGREATVNIYAIPSSA